MFDIKLYNYCNHLLVDQVLTIEGSSPAFYASLPFIADKNKRNTFIRGYNEQELYTGTATYIRNIGITNYDYSSDGSTINFGTGPVVPETIFINGLTDYPPNRYLIDYACTKEACPRCLGSGIVRDIAFSVLGKLVIVEAEGKIQQQFIKILLTELGNNTYSPTYGSELYTLLGGTITDYTYTILQKYVQDAFNTMLNIQATEDLLPEERVVRISKMNISQDAETLSQMNLEIWLTTAEYKEVRIIINLLT